VEVQPQTTLEQITAPTIAKPLAAQLFFCGTAPTVAERPGRPKIFVIVDPRKGRAQGPPFTDARG
jgi:hypothetical protein